MSVRTVARKDLTSVRRSRTLWGGVVVLALLVALVAYAFRGYQLAPREQVLNLLRTLVVGIGVVAPLVAIVLSYLAIAGERRTGGILFLLSAPNTRRDVYFGKLASRLLIAGGGLVLVYGTGMAVARATHGALPAVPVLGLFALALVYVAVFVVVAVAVSASFASRSRAIAAAIGSYFLLVIFFVVPGLRLSNLVAFAHQELLGAAANPDLYDAVSYLSPHVAFRKAVNLVFPPEYAATVFHRGREMPEPAWYLGDETSLAVFAAWLVVPLLVGYLRFDRADLK